MDWDFAAIGQLVRTLPASYPVLVHRLASLLRASFRPRLAASVISPLRFAITSRPSRCEEDFHLQAVDHARHTKESPAVMPGSPSPRPLTVGVITGELSQRVPHPL